MKRRRHSVSLSLLRFVFALKALGRGRTVGGSKGGGGSGRLSKKNNKIPPAERPHLLSDVTRSRVKTASRPCPSVAPRWPCLALQQSDTLNLPLFLHVAAPATHRPPCHRHTPLRHSTSVSASAFASTKQFLPSVKLGALKSTSLNLLL